MDRTTKKTQPDNEADWQRHYASQEKRFSDLMIKVSMLPMVYRPSFLRMLIAPALDRLHLEADDGLKRVAKRNKRR